MRGTDCVFKYNLDLSLNLRFKKKNMMRSSYRSEQTCSYNKTNQMHKFLKFIFGIKLCMFWTVPQSIIRSLSLYTQQWYVIQIC